MSGNFNENNLLSSNQSGFKPRDSCISELISATNDILILFDEDYEVRGVTAQKNEVFH